MCPQADGVGEQQLSAIIRKFSINRSTHQAKASNRELKEIGPQADGVGEQQLSAIRQQFLIIYANRLFTMND